MKKTVFLKNGPSHNLPKIKYVISEPHEDLLQWNLSWALTFDFLVHQEGGVKQRKNHSIITGIPVNTDSKYACHFLLPTARISIPMANIHPPKM